MTIMDRSFDGDGAVAGRLWTHGEAASFLGLSESTLYHLSYGGAGPRSFKVGRYRRYAESDVLAWLDTRASQPRIAV
jgi:predicted DNA-binding transcriptional regulator AlpA